MPTKNIFRKTNRPLVNAKSACLVAMSVLSIGGFLCGSFSPVVKADTYDDQINALQAQNREYEAQAGALRMRAGTLAEEIANLNREKEIIQGGINRSIEQVEKLKQEIIKLQNKIEENKKALGEVLAQIYLADQVSGIERLASSKNLAEYLDAEVARNNIQDTLNKKLNEIKAQKIKLEDTQKKVEAELRAQEQQKAQLVAKENEKNRILAETKGNEAEYNKLASANNQQINKLHAEKAAALAASAARQRGGVPAGSSSGGGYPSIWANAPKDYYVDSWGLYSRECVSYTAWRVYSSGRYMPYFGGRGHAYQWPSTARSYGIATGWEPKAGAVGIMSQSMAGYWTGHALYVESVVQGKYIIVSDYNRMDDGLYRYYRMDWSDIQGMEYIYF